VNPIIKTVSRVFVWAGGALFVASLAYCAWWYLMVAAAPAVWRGVQPALIDGLLFTIFAGHHSVFARTPIKAAVARIIPEPLLRSFYVWIASLLLIGALALWRPVGGDLYHVTGWRAVLHALLQLFGIGVIAKAVATIDPLELAGIRTHANAEALQVAGPYRWVRHPVYLGWVLAAFGAAHMTGDRFAFAVITTIYLVLAVPWEERSLLQSFGEEYRRYKQRVRWRIVPYVY
jgi:protein-S-isoprenylcysteine O-methyltransferase Ste14